MCIAIASSSESPSRSPPRPFQSDKAPCLPVERETAARSCPCVVVAVQPQRALDQRDSLHDGEQPHAVVGSTVLASEAACAAALFLS